MNLGGIQNLFEAIRRAKYRPKVVFASSIAVFGGSSMPKTVGGGPRWRAFLHRCLFEASSSKLQDKLKKGALDAVRQIYDMGYVVHFSCAGWDPSTHETQESAER